MPKERYEDSSGYFAFATEDEINAWKEVRDTLPEYTAFLGAIGRAKEAEAGDELNLRSTIEDLKRTRDEFYAVCKAHFEDQGIMPAP